MTPTPEQRAALDKAAGEARKAATAEREAKAKREAAPVEQVLARHQSEQDDEREIA